MWGRGRTSTMRKSHDLSSAQKGRMRAKDLGSRLCFAAIIFVLVQEARTRVGRDRNPSPGVTAHDPVVEFTRDRPSKLLHVGGFSHGVPLPGLPMNLSLSHDE